MSTIVGTNIEVTNLKYDSDTTSMIISNTGQVTIQGEGTNTTNLQQGLTKVWGKINCQGTPSILQSFNVSSVVDVATGKFECVYTNATSSTNVVTMSGQNNSTYDEIYYANQPTNEFDRADIRCSRVSTSASWFDTYRMSFTVHGDLA
tara:strand:- start:453 stop:896 length:444 start_codon:yes stop_codon:yes gene_type:complete